MATANPDGENVQIDIAVNGTKTLITAGKYCDRNIDINAEIPLAGTQFTNYYDLATITLNTAMYASSSSGMYTQSDSESNYIIIPYHHAANEPFVLRMRGINIPRGRRNLCILNSSMERITHFVIDASTSYFAHGHDEYGDAMYTFTSNLNYREWYYICFNIQYNGYASASSILTGPIITINEPIGNGGRVA